jgi:hypothetical protein
MLADRKPQSPDNAASGVRQDMFVDAIMWLRSSVNDQSHVALRRARRTAAEIRDRRIDVDLVLPLKLGPHAAELGFVAERRLDVVEDVDVDIVEHDRPAVHDRGAVVEDSCASLAE